MSTLLIPLLVKVTLIVAFGLVITALLGRAPAALRHVILLGTLISALLLPIFNLFAPRWDVAILDAAGTGISAASPRVAPNSPPAITRTEPRQETPVGRDATATAPAPFRWIPVSAMTSRAPASSLLIGWLVGSLLVLAWLALGHLRLRSLRKESWPLVANDWLDLLRDETRSAGVEQEVELCCHPDVTTPLTWGAINPVVMLTEDALEWSEEHRRIVLRHELAHVARNDARSQLAAAITCAMYWFHPLVWIAERRLRAECERACDDSVVASGTAAAVYASHLLEVARSARSFGGPGFLSVAMARPSELEGRLLALLNGQQPRAEVSTGRRWLMLTSMAAVALMVSAFRPVERERFVSVAASSVTKQTAPGPAALDPPRQVEERPALTSTPTSAANASVVFGEEADSIIERTIDVRSGGTLILDFTKSGATFTITGWDRPQVFVSGVLGGRSWRDTRTTIEPADGGVLLRNEYVGTARNTSFSHSFDIRVPQNFNVRLRSAGGGLSVSGVNGTFTGRTGGGAIEFDRASGEVDLTTGGGDITVTNSSLRGSVTTGGGAVRIDGSGRELVGHSGSGDVTYTNSRRYTSIDGDASASSSRTVNSRASGSADIDNGGIPRTAGTTTSVVGDHPDSVRYFGEAGIQRHRSGGDITLGDAPNGARVTTGGGAIRIGSSAGQVYAKTGGGPIRIGPASGSVIASTGAGNITVAFRGGGVHAADLTSGLGRIEVILPENIDAELVLETAYTNNLGHRTTIESDWQLSLTETADWDASAGTPRRYVRARHRLGKGGGVIRVRTVNGNVIVRKAG